MSTVAKIAQASESKSFKKLNPHLFFKKCAGDNCPICELQRTECNCFDLIPDHPEKPKAKKRIRQSSKPLLNKLESEFLAELKRIAARPPTFDDPDCLKEPHPQAIKFRLCNGAFYKPDFFSFAWFDGKPTAWEVKELRGKNVDRGKLALKVAASTWPEIRFFLAVKENGQWNTQEILP